MIFLHKLWLLLLILTWMGTVIAISYATSLTPTNMLTVANTTKPGCPRKCGNLTIPYPFGISDNCSINSYFTIVCNTSYNPPKAFTMLNLSSNFDADILDISEKRILLRNIQIASKCYDSRGKVTEESRISFNIINSPFTFSRESNKLTAIGCDDYALIKGYTGILANGSKTESNSIGCLALCSSPSELAAGSCSGMGCCQTIIPVGLQSFLITLSSLRNHTAPNISSFQPCAYAFLSGDDSFTFGGASDFDSDRINRVKDHVPMVLNWFVGDLNFSTNTRPTCDAAKKNMRTYACQLNSQCVDVKNFGQGGYHCKCNSGYEGNPYLKPGCTDIDECAAGILSSPCSRVCFNKPGSYKCLCPAGYVGDGLKNGTGCNLKIVSTPSTNRQLSLGLGISLGSIILVLCSWGLHILVRKRMIVKQKARHFERNGGLLLQQKMSYDENFVATMKIFTADELDKVTDHFNENRILGKGGQGTVYKGMLSEGRIVAIKKSKLLAQSTEFINEVVILSQINHRNIIKLLGCCLETEVPLLVYEFIPNGTLFHHIHHPNEEFLITWRMRLQIASDAAGALSYLHSSSSTPILHRDIKSSNILLDDKYRAKLSDFGTSKSIAPDQTHVTTRVVGTFGYLDPEYFQSSQFTEKSDVYSFGVVLVELLTGQKAIRSILDEDRSLASWFLSHMENSSLLDIIDTQLLLEGSKEEFRTVANLAKRCLYLDGRNRPTMKEVVLEIEAVLSLHLPQQNWPETQPQVGTGTKTAKSTYDGLSRSSTFYTENNSLNSAELSLLFNPR